MIINKTMRIPGLNEKKIFYILSILYIFNQVLSESQFMGIKIVNLILFFSRYAILGSFIGLFFLQNRKVQTLKMLTLGIITVFVIFSFILTDGGLSLFPMIMIILCSKGYSVNKIFKLTIITLIVAHLFVIISAKIGIVEDRVEIRFIGDYSGSVLGGLYERHNMGFMVHNQVALSFFLIYLLYIAYRREQITILENVFIMLLNYYVFILFGSRIVFILGVGTCAIYYIIKLSLMRRKGKAPKIRLLFWYLSFPFCAIISLVLTLFYREDNSFSIMMDRVLNNRLRLGKEALDYYGLGLLSFGKDAGSYNSTELLNNTVDNGYLSAYLQLGLISVILLIGIWTYLTYISEKKHNPFLTLAFVMIAIENIVNSHLVSYKMLPFFCLLLNENDYFLNLNNAVMHFLKNTKNKQLKRIGKYFN